MVNDHEEIYDRTNQKPTGCSKLTLLSVLCELRKAQKMT